MVATDDGRAAVVEALACLLLEALDAEERLATGDEERGVRGGGLELAAGHVPPLPARCPRTTPNKVSRQLTDAREASWKEAR
jgi:hypothetical protein